ncbi:hypothetical protein GCM10007928_01300 [Sulfitobacter porphyrae]|nr:hypothetical protein GCM10007928_01300 [Sulfitobacter porphyrae]
MASPAEKQAAQPSLMAHWGNQIRAAVERRKHYPAGTRSRGTVVLSIAVSTGGVLSSVAVTRSTGDRLLDQAALSAVKRARFARAPGGIPHGVHRFSLPVTFAP